LTEKELVEAARTARLNAYSPYSGFRVGACLLAKSGKSYIGCNVESVSFTPTCCAERTALFTAIAAGEREFSAIAVACDGDKPAWPCGVCRQSLMEFSPDLVVLVAGESGSWEQTKLSELLPHAFAEFKNTEVQNG
jgi:cytidine deaminase